MEGWGQARDVILGHVFPSWISQNSLHCHENAVSMAAVMEDSG